jgi:hypothetical protein
MKLVFDSATSGAEAERQLDRSATDFSLYSPWSAKQSQMHNLVRITGWRYRDPKGNREEISPVD